VSPVTAVAIYFIVWWTVLFAVLPFGVKSQHEAGDFSPGTDPGAPVMAGIGRKLIWTTLVSSALFGIGAAAYVYRIVTFDDLMGLVGLSR